MAEACEENDAILYQRGDESGGQDAWDDSALIKAYDEAVSAMKAKLAEQNPDFCPIVKSKGKKKQKKKKNKKSASSSHGWSVGDTCRAVYTEDGEVYTARIVSLDSNDTCTLEYLGYGNQETQQLAHLMPITSQPSSLRTDTASEAESVNPEVLIKKQSQNKPKRHKPASKNMPNSQKRESSGSFSFPWANQIPQPPPWGQMHPPSAFPPLNPRPFPNYPANGPGPACPPPMFPSVPPPPPPMPAAPGSENEAMYSMLISWYMSGYHTGYYQGLQQSSNASGAAAHR